MKLIWCSARNAWLKNFSKCACCWEKIIYILIIITIITINGQLVIIITMIIVIIIVNNNKYNNNMFDRQWIHEILLCIATECVILWRSTSPLPLSSLHSPNAVHSMSTIIIITATTMTQWWWSDRIGQQNKRSHKWKLYCTPQSDGCPLQWSMGPSII